MASFDAFNSNNAYVPPSFSPGQWGNMNGLLSGWGMGAQNPTAAAIQNVSPGMAPSAVAAPSVTGAPVAGGLQTGANSSGFGFNMPSAQLLLGGVQTIGSIWNAWESQKLAKKQFAFQKDVTETNLRNQIQAYNTTLEDRGRSRANTEGQSAEVAQSYVDSNRLRR